MVETLDEILRKALEHHGSDVFVVPGSQIMTKSSGKMIPITEGKAFPNDIAILVDRRTSWPAGPGRPSRPRATTTFPSRCAT